MYICKASLHVNMDTILNFFSVHFRKLYNELKAEEDERLAKEAAELAASGGDGGSPVKEEEASISGKKGGKSSAK